MLTTANLAAGRRLPHEPLAEIHDMLALALDATALPRPVPYPQHLREARSYMRSALRRTRSLMGEGFA